MEMNLKEILLTSILTFSIGCTPKETPTIAPVDLTSSDTISKVSNLYQDPRLTIQSINGDTYIRVLDLNTTQGSINQIGDVEIIDNKSDGVFDNIWVYHRKPKRGVLLRSCGEPEGSQINKSIEDYIHDLEERIKQRLGNRFLEICKAHFQIRGDFDLYRLSKRENLDPIFVSLERLHQLYCSIHTYPRKDIETQHKTTQDISINWGEPLNGDDSVLSYVSPSGNVAIDIPTTSLMRDRDVIYVLVKDYFLKTWGRPHVDLVSKWKEGRITHVQIIVKTKEDEAYSPIFSEENSEDTSLLESLRNEIEIELGTNFIYNFGTMEDAISPQESYHQEIKRFIDNIVK